MLIIQLTAICPFEQNVHVQNEYVEFTRKHRKTFIYHNYRVHYGFLDILILSVSILCRKFYINMKALVTSLSTSAQKPFWKDMLANRLLGGVFCRRTNKFLWSYIWFYRYSSGVGWMILILSSNPATCNQTLPPLL